MATLQFLGAVGHVTGSKHMLTTQSGTTILLDAGLYQGEGSEVVELNRRLDFDPAKLDFVLLTHAHIDHSGWLPYLRRMGFGGKVICTPATRDLCEILLRDAAYIQGESDRKDQAEELFDIQDVEQVLEQFHTISYDRRAEIADGVFLTFLNSGHMLGSALILIEVDGCRICYTGDVGRPHSHILKSPDPIPDCDVLITESTYGDRLHDDMVSVEQQLQGIVEDTCIYRHGRLLIPSFSVGRTQEIVFLLRRMMAEGYLPTIPIYVDSPMSCRATRIYQDYLAELGSDLQDWIRFDDDPFGLNEKRYIERVNDSKWLSGTDSPCVILSASGMMESGRVLYHLKHLIGDSSATILIAGYCSPGTLGAQLQNPERSLVSVLGQQYDVRAQIIRLEGLSGHADQRELTAYIHDSLCCGRAAVSSPKIYLVHGENSSSEVLREHLISAGFERVEVPKMGETVQL